MMKRAALLLTLAIGGIAAVSAVLLTNKQDLQRSQSTKSRRELSQPVTKPVHEAAQPAPAPRRISVKEGTLAEGLSMPWTRIQIALATDDGCTGLHPMHELLISRGANGMTISGKECIEYGRFADVPVRPLAEVELEKIFLRLEDFYQTAEHEIDPGEHFRSMPPSERLKQMEAYELEHGARYGGFGGTFFYVRFDSGTSALVVRNAFEKPKSSEDFVNWMRIWWHSCWLTLDQ